MELTPAQDDSAEQSIEESTRGRYIQISRHLWIDRLTARFYFDHPYTPRYTSITDEFWERTKPPKTRLAPGHATYLAMQIQKVGPWKERDDDNGTVVDGGGAGDALEGARQHGASVDPAGRPEGGEDAGEPPAHPAE